MFPVKRAILFKLQFFLSVSAVFTGGVISPLALAALERDKFYRLFLARHLNLLPYNKRIYHLRMEFCIEPLVRCKTPKTKMLRILVSP